MFRDELVERDVAIRHRHRFRSDNARQKRVNGKVTAFHAMIQARQKCYVAAEFIEGFRRLPKAIVLNAKCIRRYSRWPKSSGVKAQEISNTDESLNVGTSYGLIVSKRFELRKEK